MSTDTSNRPPFNYVTRHGFHFKFNAYFCSIFTKENSSNLVHLRNIVQASWCTSSISDVVISEDAVFEFLRRIDPSKACSPDDIPGCLLKEGAPWLAELLSQLYNCSQESYQETGEEPTLPRYLRRVTSILPLIIAQLA